MVTAAKRFLNSAQRGSAKQRARSGRTLAQNDHNVRTSTTREQRTMRTERTKPWHTRACAEKNGEYGKSHRTSIPLLYATRQREAKSVQHTNAEQNRMPVGDRELQQPGRRKPIHKQQWDGNNQSLDRPPPCNPCNSQDGRTKNEPPREECRRVEGPRVAARKASTDVARQETPKTMTTMIQTTLFLQRLLLADG